MSQEIIEQLKANLQLKNRLPDELYQFLDRRDGAAEFTRELPKTFAPSSVLDGGDNGVAWDAVGLFYFNQARFYEALQIYSALYQHMLVGQDQKNQRYHKGTPLVRLSDCYEKIDYKLISRRYLMLILVEDAIRESGKVSPENTGIYFRLVWGGGLTDKQLKQYAEKINTINVSYPTESRYPEWVLQSLDQNWITQVPAPQEAGVFDANRSYIRFLLDKLGDKSGKTLELLADYILSSMPGCRTARRVQTPSTDLDIVCSMEGFDLDFRSELGRYFVCESKDWGKSLDFTAMAKFCRVLDSVKARFGIVFSKLGISGECRREDAELEQLKVF